MNFFTFTFLSFRNNITSFLNLSVVVLLLIVSSSSFAGDAKQFRYNLLPSETFAYTTNTDIKQIVSEMQFTMGTSVSTNIKLDIRSIDNGKSTIGVSYSNTKITTSGMAMAGVPDGTRDYDELSKNNETLILSERGATLTKEIKSPKKSGKLNSVDRNVQSVVKALSYLITEFPDKPLKVGDSWVINRLDTIGNSGGNQIFATIVLQYTLANYMDTLGVSCAHLKCRSMTSSTSGTIEMMGRAMNFEGDGSLIGNVYVELSTGMTLVSTIDNQIDMRINMSGQDGMIIPITVETHSSVNRIAQAEEQK